MYKKLKSKSSVLFLLPFIAIYLLSMQSCLKENIRDIQGVDYTPNLAIPLFSSDLSLKDMVTNFDSGGFIKEDPLTHLLTLVYVNSFKSPSAEKLFVIPSQTWSKQLSMTATDTINFMFNTTINLPYQDTVKFAFPDPTAKVTNVLLKSGMMNLNISSTFKHSGVLTYSFPTVTKGGQAFAQSIPINYVGGPVSIVNNYDMTGYNFDLSAGGTATNSLPVDIKLVMNYTAGNPILPSDNISLQAGFTNFHFSFMDGFLGQLPFPATNDTLGIDFFNNTIPGGFGNLSFYDPRLSVEIENSFGLPVDVDFSKLKAFNNLSSILLSGAAPLLSGPVAVNFPTASQVGQTAKTSFYLDKGNSNIDNVFNSAPTGMEYAMSINSNPPGGTPYNFILDSSKFNLNLKAELPMWGKMKKLPFLDTLDLDLSAVNEAVQSVTFKINTDNGFPLDADLQIYFTDENLKRIDSLTVPGQNIIASAPVNPAGDVVGSTHKITTIVMDANRFANMKNSKKVLVVAKLISSKGGTQDIKILSTYKLAVKLGLLLNLKIQ